MSYFSENLIDFSCTKVEKMCDINKKTNQKAKKCWKNRH